jgi:hypothetical protein
VLLRQTKPERETSDIIYVLTKPSKIRKRIGYTAYEVEMHFNPGSRETLDDKILRLVRVEAMEDGGAS